MDNGTRVIHEAKPLWVYMDSHGGLVQLKLKFLANDIEGGWYEEDKTFRTFDPFYVGDDKDELILKMSKHLRKELAKAQKEVDWIRQKLKNVAS